MNTEETFKPALFEGRQIRKAFHEGEWWFSIIDVVEVLVGGDRPRKYWNDLKKKLTAEGYFEVSEKIGQLKMAAPDGKQRLTDCANSETLFRVAVMCYLLDTNICIEILRGQNPGLKQRLESAGFDPLRLCSIVWAELHCGACLLANPEQEKQRPYRKPGSTVLFTGGLIQQSQATLSLAGAGLSPQPEARFRVVLRQQ